jgi:hypothetical protein
MVAKKRSSRLQLRSRITPVNQRNAIPENTTHKTTIDEVADQFWSHSILGSDGPDAVFIKSKLIIRGRANRIPAMAVERSDLIRRRTKLLFASAMMPSIVQE